MVNSHSFSRITAAVRHVVIGLAVVGSLSACTAQTYVRSTGTNYLPQSTSRPVYIPQSIDMDIASGPELYSCEDWKAAYSVSSWPQGDSLQVVSQIDKMVRDRFHYRREEVDFWRPMHNVILGSRDHFSGDCDDLAATTAAIAICAGVPQEKIGFAITSTKGDANVANHMIAFYKNDNGTFYTLGDTQGTVRPLASTKNNVLYWKFFNYNQWWAREDIPLPQSSLPDIPRWDT